MILSRLDLKAFGHFTDVSIDLSAGPHRFHMIYGPNEAGKSTTLRAITSLLFGMSTTADDCFLHRNDRVRVGGLLADLETGETLECVRRRGRKATLRDASDDQAISDAALQSMLGGINRETFMAQYGLSYDALVEGGASIVAGTGDLGQILFSAGAGVGRLREIQAEIDKATVSLFTERGLKPKINSEIKKLDESRKELRDAQVPTSNFLTLRDELDAKNEESTKLDNELRECLDLLTRLKSMQQALPLIPSWRSHIETLDELSGTPSLDNAFTERRRQASSDREIAVRQQEDLQARLLELDSQLNLLGHDAAVMSYEQEIEQVFQQISSREKAEREQVSHVRIRRDLDRQIAELLRQLSIEIDEGDQVEAADAIEQAISGLHVNETLRARIRELASVQAGLISRRNECSDAIETTKRKLADVTQELESLDTHGDPAVLNSAIESAGNPVAEVEAMLASRQKCESLRQRCESTLQRLKGFEGGLEQAVSLALPSDASVSQLAESLRSALHSVGQKEEAIEDRQREREDCHQKLVDAQADRKLPTMEELQAVRGERDRVADRLASNDDDHASISNVQSLRDLIREADQIADTMREHSEQVHHRQTLASQLEVAEGRIRDAKVAAKDAHSHFESCKDEWLEAWRCCDVEAGQPEQMRQWLSSHAKLCDLMEQLETEENRYDQVRGRIERASRRLLQTLETVDSSKPVRAMANYQGELFDEPCDEDFVAMYDKAVSIRSQWTHDRQHYEATRRKRDELAESLPGIEIRFEAAQKDVEQWHQDWRSVTETFVTEDRAGTTEVLHMLDQLNELHNLKREKDGIERKLQANTEDEDLYRERVGQIADDLEVDFPSTRSTAAIAKLLYQRLQEERTATRGRDALQDQIASAKQSLLEIESQQAKCDVLLSQLCKEAGCRSAEELPEIERRSALRSKSMATTQELKTQILGLAGDQTLEEFIAISSQQQPAMLEVEIERATTMQEELKLRIEGVHRDIGAAQNELNRIDGGSRASEIVQSMQMSAGVVRSDVDDYARLKIGALLLHRAIEHYRNENQSPVLDLANDYFKRLSCGEYGELKPDYDASGSLTLFGVNSAGDDVPATAMSTGTADALYLSLRLASLEHQMRQGHTVPVVIDDCLVQLDDARAAAALKAFSELSMKTQVILFTHHQHLCELAKQHLAEDAVHVHTIGV